MRVLLLTDADVFAGTERMIFELARTMANFGVEPTIGCPRPSPLCELASTHGIPTLQVGRVGSAKGGISDFVTLSRLRRAFQRRDFEIVHVHNGRSALLAGLAGAGRHVPMVMSQHFLRPSRTSRSGLKGVLSNMLHVFLEKRIGRHIAICRAVRDAVIDAKITTSEKIEVVFNGVPDVALTHEADKGHSRPADFAAPYIFCAARIEPEKDLITLVRAMQIVQPRWPNLQCLIAGTGSGQAQLRIAINQLGQTERVKLLGFRDDVDVLMRGCEFFVLPAPAEPFGLVLIEAMALSRAVVACKQGGPLEIVANEQTGILVEPHNPDALAAAIDKMLNENDLRMSFGKAGRQRYLESFTAEAMAKRVADVYKGMLRQPKLELEAQNSV